MTKKFKYIFVGFVFGCILTLTTPVLAKTILQKIDVALNTVKVEINGKKLNANNILYNGTTYLPMRVVAEAVGKEVEWNQNTMTANITDESIKPIIEGDNNMEEVKIYQKDGSWFCEKNGTLYYGSSYVYKLILTYGDYLWLNDTNVNPIKITLAKEIDNGETNILIDSISYEMEQDIIFISKEYYENTILPLINQ